MSSPCSSTTSSSSSAKAARHGRASSWSSRCSAARRTRRWRAHHYNFQGQLLGMRICDMLSKGKVYYIAVVIMTTLSHEPLICYGLFITVECFCFLRNQMSCWTRLSHELLLPVHRSEESNELL
jgi:hypothetical protein